MNNPLKWLVDRVRGAQPTPATGPGDAWHTYEQPLTKDFRLVYNATPFRMPLHLTFGTPFRFVHVAPFDGVKNNKEHLSPGDWIYRRATLAERNQFVKDSLRAERKVAKGSPFGVKPIHVRRSELHAEAAKKCVLLQIAAT